MSSSPTPSMRLLYLHSLKEVSIGAACFTKYTTERLRAIHRQYSIALLSRSKALRTHCGCLYLPTTRSAKKTERETSRPPFSAS